MHSHPTLTLVVRDILDDMPKVGIANQLLFGCNGEWSVAFEDVEWPVGGIYPALTAVAPMGQPLIIRVKFDVSGWQHGPPDDTYGALRRPSQPEPEPAKPALGAEAQLAQAKSQLRREAALAALAAQAENRGGSGEASAAISLQSIT